MGRNDELRAARESMSSPTYPGEPMSRTELADAVNALLWTTTARHHGLDAHTVARYERGAIRWPSAAYRSALRAVLGASTDAELGFSPSRRGRAAARSPIAALDDLPMTSPPPTRIGWTEVEQVRASTTALAGVENVHGGGLMYPGAGAQLRWTWGMLAAQAAPEVRTALHVAVGNLAAVVASAAFDMGDHPAADRYFGLALTCADEAGSWELRSNTLSDMSRKAAYLGCWDQALSLAEFAQVRSDRVSATARAMTSMLRSRYLAMSGRPAEASDELVRSDEWMAGSDPALDPPWLCYYDAAEHQGSTARNLTALARHTGDQAPALDRLAFAVDAAAEGYPRSRAFSQIRLAALLMEAGDVGTAVAVGHQAVVGARSIRSRRVRLELDDLARLSRTRGRSGPAVELAEEIETG